MAPKSQQQEPRSLILCINCGSTSLKFAVFAPHLTRPECLFSGSLGESKDPSQPQGIAVKLKKHPTSALLNLKKDVLTELPWENFTFHKPSSQFDALLSVLSNLKYGDHELIEAIQIVTHRVVHGAGLATPIHIRKDHVGCLPQLERLNDLAPLHNIPATQVIEAAVEKMAGNDKGPWHLVYTDTAFHQTVPEHIYTIPVNPKNFTEGLPGGQPVRRWGFHGLAYRFIASETAAYLGRPLEELNIIAAQLGGGASVCAIKQGKSYDTSMGFTPLEGLPGATRSGNVDPCLGYHLIPASLSRQDPSKLTRKIGDVELATSEYLLNKDSGFKALAGTGDFEMIVSGIKSFGGLLDESERKRYKLTFDLFVDRLVGYLGAYYFKLAPFGRVDAVVLSGGLGENSVELRETLLKQLQNTPLALSADAGSTVGASERETIKDLSRDAESARFSAPVGTNGVTWLICQVDEQLECAKRGQYDFMRMQEGSERPS